MCHRQDNPKHNAKNITERMGKTADLVSTGQDQARKMAGINNEASKELPLIRAARKTGILKGDNRDGVPNAMVSHEDIRTSPNAATAPSRCSLWFMLLSNATETASPEQRSIPSEAFLDLNVSG